MKLIKLLILTTLFILSSCSSLNKSMIYPALGAGTLSAFAGAALSPNKESRNMNALVFGISGAIGGALLGRFFYNENPENKPLPSMILPKTHQETNSIDFIPSTNSPIESPIVINTTPIKKYNLPEAPIPEELKAFAKKQYAIEYQVEGKVIEKGNSSYYIKPTTVIEYKVE